MVEVIPEKLNLFEGRDTLYAVSESHFEKIQCRTALPDVGIPPSLEFSANSSLSHYTDLSESFLLVTGKYVRATGGNLGAAPKVAPVQNLIGSLFKSVNMYLNNKKITPPENNMAYIHFFNHFIQPRSAQDCQLQLAGWYPDTHRSLQHLLQNNPQTGGSVNEGLKKRSQLIAESHQVTVASKLFAAPHLITRLFPPNCKFDWQLETNPQQFFTIQADDEVDGSYRFVITNAEIWLKRVSVSPGLSNSHSELAQSMNMCYPCKYMQSSSIEIPVSSFGFKYDGVFQGGQMPLAVFCMFIHSEAKNGNVHRNPYVFEHANLNELKLHMGSKTFPSVGYTINPRAFQIEQALLNTYLALNVYGAKSGPADINRDTFIQGAMILGFDLTRNSDPTANYHNTDFDASSLNIEGKFSSATDKAYTFLVLGVFNGKLELSGKQMEPITSWI